MGFDSFGLDEALLQGTKDLGYQDPTPIQEQAIPAVLGGRDVIGLAQTGTGKTAAFLLPILHRLLRSPGPVTRCLVLAPTRELVQQIETVCVGLTYRTSLSMANVIGGADMSDQTRALKAGADIVIATPGRLLDHFYYGYPKTDKLEFLVLDEADRMLDMGFMPDIEKIVRRLPEKRQTLLFSATLPPAIEKLAKTILVDPVMIEIGNRRRPAESVSQELFEVDHRRKPWFLVDLLKQRKMESVLVFTATKLGANRLWSQLSREGVKCAVIHGDREQAERFAALESFRQGNTPVLVATDIAARGIDVSGISHVVNYDVPRSPEDYIHRIGRTGRAGETGHAITLCAPDEKYKLTLIEKTLKIQLPRGDAPSRPERGRIEGGREDRGRDDRGRDDRKRPSSRRDAAPREESRGAPARRDDARRDDTRRDRAARDERESPRAHERMDRHAEEAPRRPDRDRAGDRDRHREPDRTTREPERSRARTRDDEPRGRDERRSDRGHDSRRRDLDAHRENPPSGSSRRPSRSADSDRHDDAPRRRTKVTEEPDRGREPRSDRTESRRSRSNETEHERPRRPQTHREADDRPRRDSDTRRSHRDPADRDDHRRESPAPRGRDHQVRSDSKRDRPHRDDHRESRSRDSHPRRDGERGRERGHGRSDAPRRDPEAGRTRASGSRSERSDRDTRGSSRDERSRGHRDHDHGRRGRGHEYGTHRGEKNQPRRGDPRVQPRSEGSKKFEDDPRFEWE